MRNKHRNVGFVLKINSNLCRQRGRLRVAQGQLFITGTHLLTKIHFNFELHSITINMILTIDIGLAFGLLMPWSRNGTGHPQAMLQFIVAR